MLKPHSEVGVDDAVERGNMPGAAGCIFPEAPTDVSPVLDYSVIWCRLTLTNPC